VTIGAGAFDIAVGEGALAMRTKRLGYGSFVDISSVKKSKENITGYLGMVSSAGAGK
jgi:hypothetical protein